MPTGNEPVAPRLWRWLVALLLLAGCRPAASDLTWEQVQERGAMRVGLDPNWVPFEYVDAAGQLAGFDVDLARALAERLDLQVHFVADLPFDGLYDALTAGRVDALISAVVVDPVRRADFAYSAPYFDAGQVLIVARAEPDVHGPADLVGRVLAVELGSVADSLARRWARRTASLALLHLNSASAALDAVAAGEASAALTDHASALIALHDGRSDDLQVVGQPFTSEQYAIVVRRDSPVLLAALNDALAALRRDGTLQALQRRWLGP